MRDQKERIDRMERRLRNEFRHALAVNLITQEQHDNYLQELNELTSYIYERYKDSFTFRAEDWRKINNYYEKIIGLDFVRSRTKEGLEDDWLIEM
ncbi:hypothetical protein J3U09_00675 [Gilliamella sp. B2889]|uniref:hypothetical protein n=1 Tax=Gilliamella sp. B2889 TaxID=2817985 RepID=UPI002269C68B|nr:hypothetical protein [Gilliamella sp. B2889]MCX8682232.1 hypothetical protein [Gilliamella sp. B2889]